MRATLRQDSGDRRDRANPCYYFRTIRSDEPKRSLDGEHARRGVVESLGRDDTGLYCRGHFVDEDLHAGAERR